MVGLPIVGGVTSWKIYGNLRGPPPNNATLPQGNKGLLCKRLLILIVP